MKIKVWLDTERGRVFCSVCKRDGISGRAWTRVDVKKPVSCSSCGEKQTGKH